jgi:Predicted endonuclease containing a URI domain
MTNSNNNVLYTGVTSNLPQRVHQHRTKATPGSFTDKYNCTKLVWYQSFDRIEDAISEEKRLKAGNRQQKLNLIIKNNAEWKDLWEEITQ